MPINVGTSTVSEMQREMLASASAGGSLSELDRYFATLMEDEDINDGSEELHPGWRPFFERYKAAVGTERAQRFEAFFNRISLHDPGVSTIDPRSARICFLLGAGASKPEPSSIPTVKELLPVLLERARRLDREEVNDLASYCTRANIDNIEDLLTAAQLSEFCTRNRAVLQLVDFLLFRRQVAGDERLSPGARWPLRDRRLRDWDAPVLPSRRGALAAVSSVAFLQDTLQLLFGLLSSTMLPAQPNKAHEAIASHVQVDQDTAIVTTNYDCCMDAALRSHDLGFSYAVEFSGTAERRSDQRTKLLKLHGSLNWFYCETCQKVHLIDIERTVTDYLENGSPYPVVGVCRDCGGQRRGLLVPPLAMKFNLAPPLNPLLDQADKAFGAAELIVVVGFSFAEADLYISRMLSKAMQAAPNKKLVLVDPDTNVVERVRRKFAIRVPKFDENRVLAIRGSCVDMLPAFLSGAFLQTTASESVVAAN